MIIDEEREEMIAAARRMPNTTTVQLPDRPADTPEYVKTDTAVGNQLAVPASADTATTKVVEAAFPNLKPIDTTVKMLQLNQTADTSKAVEITEVDPLPQVPVSSDPAVPTVELRLGVDLAEMRAGEKIMIPVLIRGSATFRSAVFGLKFDDKKIAVRNVQFGDVFGLSVSNTTATPFLNQNGKMYVSLTAKDGNAINPAGTLAYVEIEMLKNGRPEISFDRDVLNFLTSEGKNFVVKFQE
jgi:hypothetical protein